MSITLTKNEREMERANAVEALQRFIPSRRTVIHTRTDYMRGQTDYVQVYVVNNGRIRDITYFVAKAAGRRMTDRGIAYGGGGYSKGLEAADDCWRARFNEPLRQSQWERLS
jgi:hypothetical protein